MGLITGVDSKEITRTNGLENSLKSHFNMINTKSYFPKAHVEEVILRQKQFELWRMSKENRFKVPEGLVKFTPSSASKCRRELFYKALRAPQDDVQNAPFNNRWTRNSTAVHEAVQRDLLYAESLLKNPAFTPQMIEKEGFGLLPAWEKVVEDYKVIEHKGVKFVVSGMMDGILTHNKDGSTVGFEFKTKTNDCMQVQKMKKPSAAHIQQCVAYSLIFETPDGEPINDFLLTYEAVPKDRWDSGSSAYDDLRVFHIQVTKRQKTNLLNKFADVAAMVEDGEIPKREVSKCLFCPYKGFCAKGGN